MTLLDSCLILSSAQGGQGLSYFAALGFDEVEQFFRRAGVFLIFGVRVDGLQVVVLLLDFFPRDGPASVTVATSGKQWGINSPSTKPLNAPGVPPASSLRLCPSGAAQSCQR